MSDMPFLQKRMYFSKTLNTQHPDDFGQIRLKHRELFLSESMQRAARDTVDEARQTVIKAIAVLNTAARPPKVSAALDRFFKCGNPAPGNKVEFIKTVLILVSNGINGDVDMKLSKMNDVYLQPGENADRIDGYVRGINQGDMHVNPDRLMKPRLFQAVRTFIHEASHKFANTEDFDEKGYMDPTPPHDFRQSGIQHSECMRNADSYAYFAMVAAKAYQGAG